MEDTTTPEITPTETAAPAEAAPETADQAPPQEVGGETDPAPAGPVPTGEGAVTSPFADDIGAPVETAAAEVAKDAAPDVVALAAEVEADVAKIAGEAEVDLKKIAADARAKAITALQEIEAELPEAAGNFFIGATRGFLLHCIGHLGLFLEQV